MAKNIQDILTRTIARLLQDIDCAPGRQDKSYLDFPSDPRFGDLSTNVALQLSKQLKKNPVVIARELAERLTQVLQDEQGSAGDVREVKVEGAGFINFYLSDGYFYAYLADLVSRGEAALRAGIGQGKPVLIEFVSANPTGPLSVAHARQAAVGDVLANIFNFMGFKAQREYYLNDEGNQINILGRSIALRMEELQGEKIEFPEDHYQGEYIYDIAKVALARNIEASGCAEFGTAYILDIIKKELDDFGVAFDSWFSQKALGTSGKIEEAFASLKQKGFLYEDDGALWFKSTAFGDDKDRVVIKSDGSYTYLAPDIAYHQDKYSRGFQWLINLWGPDHHGYINRLKASVEAFGHPSQALSIIIVQLATIFRQGKPVQMSTRKGQYITLREVLDEVGRDAARFFFLMRRTSSHLDFDLEVAKKQTSENPVYYVQYAHARICSILSNSPENLPPVSEIDFSVLKEKEEIALIKKLWQFPHTLEACIGTLDPYLLTVYLQETAEHLHKFYDQHRVLGQEDALTFARLGLLQAARTVIATGLTLLGVLSPQKM
jgi:arginyl-tRNA synthetase